MLLTDEFVERRGSHPGGQRRDALEIGGFTLGE
jgi:hypothetical protein